jgi:hypothetical protein
VFLAAGGNWLLIRQKYGKYPSVLSLKNSPQENSRHRKLFKFFVLDNAFPPMSAAE